MVNVYGYARVSSRGQSYEIQEENIISYCKIKNFDLMRIFADKKSGKDMGRPAFQEMMDMLEENIYNIEAIITTKLDRVGRSIRDLLALADWCKERNIGIVFIQNNIDTTTKEGRLYFYLMSALAEYEREIINERTEEGKKRYVERGGKFGRPKIKLPMKEINRLIAEGVSKSEVARKFKVDRGTIYRKRLEEDTKNDEEIKDESQTKTVKRW